MTARDVPALPPAAGDPAQGRNDPARLPPVPVIGVVSSPNSAWRGGMKHTVVMDGTSLASSCDRESAQFAVEIARLAIARALGGDGEPVAWWARNQHRADDQGIVTFSVSHADSMRRDGYRVVPLYTRPAATGDTGEGDCPHHSETGLGGCGRFAWHCDGCGRIRWIYDASKGIGSRADVPRGVVLEGQPTGEVEKAARTAALYVDEAWRKGAPKSAWHPIKATLMRDAIRAATGGPDAR